MLQRLCILFRTAELDGGTVRSHGEKSTGAPRRDGASLDSRVRSRRAVPSWFRTGGAETEQLVGLRQASPPPLGGRGEERSRALPISQSVLRPSQSLRASGCPLRCGTAGGGTRIIDPKTKGPQGAPAKIRRMKRFSCASMESAAPGPSNRSAAVHRQYPHNGPERGERRGQSRVEQLARTCGKSALPRMHHQKIPSPAVELFLPFTRATVPPSVPMNRQIRSRPCIDGVGSRCCLVLADLQWLPRGEDRSNPDRPIGGGMSVRSGKLVGKVPLQEGDFLR